MSANVTDCPEDGLICCGLTRGITFSIRHITTMIATKNRIATTGSQLIAHVCSSCVNEVWRRARRRFVHGDRVGDRVGHGR